MKCVTETNTHSNALETVDVPRDATCVIETRYSSNDPPLAYPIVQCVLDDLASFRAPRDLLVGLGDAMEAHQMMYDVHGVLHRDISASNILLTDSLVNNRRDVCYEWDHTANSNSNMGHDAHGTQRCGSNTAEALVKIGRQVQRGILADWDHSLSTDRVNPVGIHQMSAWRSMSTHLKMSPGAAHTLVDGRESSLLVLMYMSIRYLRDPKSSAGNVKYYLEQFDEVQERVGMPHVGNYAWEHIYCSGGPKVQFRYGPIRRIIEELCECMAARYDTVPVCFFHRPTFAQELKQMIRDDGAESLEAPAYFYETFREYASMRH
ncbi:hypothetical protein PLEOSDRAFT_1101018 [Pleurotus ostreatus PC15]|uniref:Fungal-type protein kinase domain-containing protein n=2 Tax=Pleurotus TaxID=5320 RepID=A0A067NPI5_PLEO1|nr:hypothetical protein CCMSSC00406_0007603 [Pleurotus cornucopiae]KDQ29988.1 hypothetical protein PLEOSDRAFT_1101018 [Pleurotus ostreatus PC15]